MNEWEFTEPDEEDAEELEMKDQWRHHLLFEAVQTFAPEFKEYPNIMKIVWSGSLNKQ